MADRKNAGNSTLRCRAGQWQGLESLEERQLLAAVITAAFTPVAMPQTTPISDVALTFSKGVQNVGVNDFSLTRDGSLIDLSEVSGRMVRSAGYANWHFSFPTDLTTTAGDYVLTLTDDYQTIQTLDGVDTMAPGAVTLTWTVSATFPTATVTIDPAFGYATVSDTATIVFSEPVTGFDLSKITLLKGQDSVDLAAAPAAVLTTSDQMTWHLSGLKAKAGAAGDYTLTASAAGVTNAGGLQVGSDATTSWTLAAGPAVITVVSAAAGTDDSGLSPGQLVLFRAGPIDQALTVKVAIGGTAKAPKDYTATGLTGKTVVFAANSATATVNVTPVADQLAEPDQTVTLTLSKGAGYTANTDKAKAAATVTIVDSSPTVSISATDASAAETGDTGTFRVSRGAAIAGDLTVNLKISGTAKGGTNYATINKTVTILDGTDHTDITVTPTNVAKVERDKTVIVTLAKGTTYHVSPVKAQATASVTITDDSPHIRIEATDNQAHIAGLLPATFTVTRTGGDMTKGVIVPVTIKGTAKSGKDYTTTGLFDGAVVFLPHETTAIITITPIASAKLNSTVIISLKAGKDYLLEALSSDTITILA